MGSLIFNTDYSLFLPNTCLILGSTSQHAEKEHVEVEEYLAKLSRLSIDGEKWMEQFGELKHAVSHHVKEEEEEIFEKAKQVLNKEQEKQLVLVMDKMKADISLNK